MHLLRGAAALTIVRVATAGNISGGRVRALQDGVGTDHASVQRTAQAALIRAPAGGADGPGGRSPRPVCSTRTSAGFDALLPFEAWRALGTKMGVYSNATAWWLGDWMLFGRMKYGRRYKDAIAETGLDYQTLRNYAMVARRFEPSRRRQDLTFQHHAEVCPLDDDSQDNWLARAAALGWSRNELRRHLRAALTPDAAASVEVVKLTIESARANRWRQAAAEGNLDLDVWILQILDHAIPSA